MLKIMVLRNIAIPSTEVFLLNMAGYLQSEEKEEKTIKGSTFLENHRQEEEP